MSTTDPRPQSTPPAPSSRWFLVRAAVTGAVSGVTRALLTWLLEQH
jgi:hypothetical protein